MRLAGQAKLGYYPTPEKTLAFLLTWLSRSGPGYRRYFDPCVGAGEALETIAAHHGPAETYGIELSDVRAEAAAEGIDHVLPTGYENAVLTEETFSLCLLNPPYTGEEITGGGTRLEETFLLPTTPLLVPGGVLVYLIPHARINERIARHLAGWYDHLRCFKLPAGEYEAFKQVVIFGTRRAGYKPPSNDEVKGVLAWQSDQSVAGSAQGAGDDLLLRQSGVFQATLLGDTLPQRAGAGQAGASQLPELAAGDGSYSIPVSSLRGKNGKPFRFQYYAVSDEALLREAEVAAARLEQSHREWRDLCPVAEPPILHPVITPKKGHIASQLSGGLLGTNLVQQDDGMYAHTPLLLKGGQRKYTVVIRGDEDEEAEIVVEDRGRQKTLRRVDLEERFETVLTTLNAEGELCLSTDPQAIAGLIKTHVEQLAGVVMARNVPQYDLQPESWEWAALDPLSRGHRLPGMRESGLTPFQRHLTIANGRLLLGSGAGILMAEMASGKSRMGLALAEYLRAALERRFAYGRRGEGEKRGKGVPLPLRPSAPFPRRSPYPVLIAGPGVVTGEENWPKEIAETIPGAHSRVVTAGVRPFPKPEKIGRWLTGLGVKLDEAAFEGLPAAAVWRKIMLAANEQGRALTRTVARALVQALKRAERDQPPKRTRAQAANLLDGRLGGFLWLGLTHSTSSGQAVPRDEAHAREVAGKYSLAQFVDEYRRGLLPEKSFAILSYETAKLGPGRVPAMRTKTVRSFETNLEGEVIRSTLVQVCTCPHCGAVVAEVYDPEAGEPISGWVITPLKAANWVTMRRRFCQAPAPRWVWDEEVGKRTYHTHDAEGHPYICGAPLFEQTALRREAAAEYARKKAKDVFGLLLVDEIHMAKAKGTGVGWALAALHAASRYTLGLTGTLFGGYSTSIFWLLYRLVPQVRQAFGFSDEMRWARKYGLLKTTFYVEEDEAVEEGTYTGTRFRETVREKPGISSAIVGLALERCTFSSLKDVGLPLPPYREEIVRLPLTADMDELLLQADGSQEKPPTGLLAWALERQKEEDGKGAISVWLNTALNWPDAAFRARDVVFHTRSRDQHTLKRLHKTEFVTHLPALSGWLPKETWLAETCLAERLQGRKVLVYLRQTGEHDIQPRLAECLQTYGLRVSILRPSLAPRQRAGWIKRHADGFDVLLTNARLVQVGLNLTSFATGIFYELDLSLYVVWQSMRRLYRPGQPLPVRMLFPIYEDTLEARMLDLIGSKMLAAQIFYGDDVSGALVEEGAESDLLGDLVRAALGEINVGRAEGVFSLGGEQHAHAEEPPAFSDSSGGNSVPDDPPLPDSHSGSEVAFVVPEPVPAWYVPKRRKSKRTPPEGQLSLW